MPSTDTRHDSADESCHLVRAEHARTLQAIPLREFMGTTFDRQTAAAAKAQLVQRALSGEEVYAYHPAGRSQWVIWDPQTLPNCAGRISPVEWTQHYVTHFASPDRS